MKMISGEVVWVYLFFVLIVSFFTENEWIMAISAFLLMLVFFGIWSFIDDKIKSREKNEKITNFI